MGDMLTGDSRLPGLEEPDVEEWEREISSSTTAGASGEPQQQSQQEQQSRPHHRHHHHHHRHHRRKEESCEKWCGETLENVFSPWIVAHFFFYVVYLAVGSTFYSISDSYGFYRGFYYAVNVGLSIGWCYEKDETEEMMYFSAFYCIAGTFLVAYLVIYYSYKIYLYHLLWDRRYHAHKQEEREHERKMKQDAGNVLALFMDDVTYWYWHHDLLVNTWGVFFLFIVFLMTWGCVRYGWSSLEGFYFAFACLSTSGIITIPDDSAESDYFVVSFVTALGVPVLNLGLFGVMTAIVQWSRFDITKSEILEGVTASELRALRSLGVDEGDALSPMTNNEYVVLILMRNGLLDTELYQRINIAYSKLDAMAAGADEAGRALEEQVRRNSFLGGGLRNPTSLLSLGSSPRPLGGEDAAGGADGTSIDGQGPEQKRPSTGSQRGRQVARGPHRLSLLDLMVEKDRQDYLRRRDRTSSQRGSVISEESSSPSVDSYTSGSEKGGSGPPSRPSSVLSGVSAEEDRREQRRWQQHQQRGGAAERGGSQEHSEHSEHTPLLPRQSSPLPSLDD